jgi:hypothetical protein
VLDPVADPVALVQLDPVPGADTTPTIEGFSFVRRRARGGPAGRRTATLRAVTGCRVAVVPEGLLDREALAELAEGRSSQRPRRG